MAPVVKSGDLCEFVPFQEGSSVAYSINVGDVVFCAVQPKNFYCAHFDLETHFDEDRNEHYCIIGNKDGRRHGHCYKETIHGKLMWSGNV